jgi:hypothetical protein
MLSNLGVVKNWPALLRMSLLVFIGLVMVSLLADGFVPGPAHDVHTPGATPIAATLVSSEIRNVQTIQPSQSIADIRCQLWHALRTTPCTDDIASAYFASVAQTHNTLYLIWTGCVRWHGAGAIINWQGYNLEYLPPDRKLVIHCYVAAPWMDRYGTLSGVVAIPSASLLVVPTGPMSPGLLQIIEDDRLEHLVGDQSTEFQLAIATIS